MALDLNQGVRNRINHRAKTHNNFQFRGMYKIILNSKYHGLVVPVTPETITFSNSDNTEIDTLVNGHPFTLPKLDGVKTIKFSFNVPRRHYPFTQYHPAYISPPEFLVKAFEEIKCNKEVLELIIYRDPDEKHTRNTNENVAKFQNENMKVLLTDWSCVEDANDMSDFTFDITLVTYHTQANQELTNNEVQHLIATGEAQGWSNEIKGALREAVGQGAENGLSQEEQRRRMHEILELYERGLTPPWQD